VPLYTFDAAMENQNLKAIDIDPTYGRLCLVQGQSQVKLFRLNSTNADYLTNLTLNRDRIITSSEFTPFGSGLALLTEKSDNVEIF